MSHEQYIRCCLELATKGRGKVKTNPMVGSVLVSPSTRPSASSGLAQDDIIVAEAFHEAFGQLHAERALLERYNGQINSDDTLYVNLEPCCHKGKTPPCTDIILEKGVRKVVFGMYDPNPQISGKGIEALRSAGIEVIGPVLSEVCERFNRGFVSVQNNGRPWITLKKAQTRTGQISNKDGSPLKITSQEQDEWSHAQLRAKHDAILVGVQTVINDDPQLTVRYGDTTFQPIRIILDPNKRMPKDAKVSGQDTKVIDYPFDLKELISSLAEEGIMSVLVEGGERTWKYFRDAGMVDEEVVLIGR